MEVFKGILAFVVPALTVWFMWSSSQIFGFFERQKEKDTKLKLAKLEKFTELYKEGLISYKEFEKNIK